jgi:cell division inhibitor SulA
MNASLDQLLQHPHLWRATAQRDFSRSGLSTGFTTLDGALEQAGWPQDGLIELLSDQQGIGELRTLLPTLKTLTQNEDRWVAWVAPPHLLSAPALEAAGLRLDRLLLIHPKTPQEQLWAMEQALKSGTCSALLGWLDPRHVTPQVLRRLQLAARSGGTLAFLFRPEAAAQEASPAELRLRLEAGEHAQEVRLHVLKRRGGWPLEPFELALSDPLSQQLGMAFPGPLPRENAVPASPLAATLLEPSAKGAAEPPRRLWAPRGPFRDAAGAPPEAPSRSTPLAHRPGGNGSPQAARH